MKIGLNGLRAASTALVVFILASAVFRAEAQVVYGSIVGTVQDPDGRCCSERRRIHPTAETGQTRQPHRTKAGELQHHERASRPVQRYCDRDRFPHFDYPNLDVTAATLPVPISEWR